MSDTAQFPTGNDLESYIPKAAANKIDWVTTYDHFFREPHLAAAMYTHMADTYRATHPPPTKPEKVDLC